MLKRFCYLLLIIAISCSKEEACDPMPKMGSTTLIEKGYTKVMVSGTITPPECETSITSQGFVIDDEQLPTVSNGKSVKSGTNIQTTFENLTPNTTYYIRTFLTNIDGDFYGPQFSVKTQNPGVNFNDTKVEKSFETATFSSKYSFAEGDGANIESKGFLINSKRYTDSNSPNGSISVSRNDIELNSNYAYKAFVKTQFGEYYSDELSFKSDDPSSKVEELEISNISFSEASFSAKYTNSYEGDDITTEKGFIYSKSSDFSGQVKLKSSSTEKTFTAAAESLGSNQKYYVKAYVENSYGTYTSESSSFETLDAGYSFSNTSAGSIEYDIASLSSEYAQKTGDKLDIEEKGFYYSENEDMTQEIKIISGAGDGLIGVDLQNLVTAKKYYYQAYLVNGYGTWRSEVFNFITKDATPEYDFDIVEGSVALDKVNSTIKAIIPDDVKLNNFYIDLVNENNNVTTRIDYLQTVDSSFKGGTIEYEFSSILPTTKYLVDLIMETEYGTFNSGYYSFNTKSDVPYMKSFITLSSSLGENQVLFQYNIKEVQGDIPKKIYLKYKNNEDSNYITVNLPLETNETENWNVDNQQKVLSNIVMGPEYEYILHYENEWNTYTEEIYHVKPVTYKVGDEKFGGIIAYIDETGYHGIILAKSNSYSSELQFLKNSNDLDLSSIEAKTFPTGEKTDGMENSLEIKEHYNSLNIETPAIDYALNYSSNGFDDWYVVSYREAVKLWPFLESTSSDEEYEGILNKLMWTSNSVSFGSATAKLDYSGFKFYTYRKNSPNNSRVGEQYPFSFSGIIPVRKF